MGLISDSVLGFKLAANRGRIVISELLAAADVMIKALNQEVDHLARLAVREFTEKVTFAEADEILHMLRTVNALDWMALPPWARNLAYRLACLQRPGDVDLLREAAIDLYSFGPDWDEYARALDEQADSIEAAGR
jgi:hypothetical protein